MSKTFLFQTIQFSISMQFSSVWSIDRTLSGATTTSQSGHGSDSNEQVLRILQSSSVTEASPSDCLVSYPGHSLVGGLPLCREAVGVFYGSSQMGHVITEVVLSPLLCLSQFSSRRSVSFLFSPDTDPIQIMKNESRLWIAMSLALYSV